MPHLSFAGTSAQGRGHRMLRRCLSAILAMGIGAAVHAADDIEAKAQACAACHGNNGVPIDPKTIPVIWGQEASYLMKQLRDFRNGERESAVMSPIAKSLAEGDLRPMATYFAGLFVIRRILRTPRSRRICEPVP